MLNTIMLIDNSAINNQLFETLNRKNNIFENTMSYTNGIKALEFLVQNHHDINELPDAIILDSNLSIIGLMEFLHTFNSINAILTKVVSIYVVYSTVKQDGNDEWKKYNFIKGVYNRPLTVNELLEISGQENTLSSAG